MHVTEVQYAETELAPCDPNLIARGKRMVAYDIKRAPAADFRLNGATLLLAASPSRSLVDLMTIAGACLGGAFPPKEESERRAHDREAIYSKGRRPISLTGFK